MFVAEVPAFRACYAQGQTFEEALDNIHDVIGMCIKEMQERGEEVRKTGEIVGFKRVEVVV